MSITKIDLNAIISEQLVKVPEGNIELRDDRLKEKWIVEIKPFSIFKYPVTQDLYLAVTSQNPSTFKGGKLPVETVSWIDAVNFCNALSEAVGKDKCYTIDLAAEHVTIHSGTNGFRLPTEAEWQYACQAGKKDIKYGELIEIAWFKENSNNRTHEVGQKTPNNWGLYDMLGNVWEWCSDIYDETVYGTYRIFRGGGWCDQERSVMATNRRRSHPIKFQIDDLGFRIVKNN